jgi:FAD/FMN-containing dehydrogenase
MSTTLDSTLVADLAGQISGSVLGPQDAGYDATRAVHNGLIDRRPALIVRCRTTNDVIAALALARRAGLEVSIRGGGHNVAGRAVTEGGVVIDLAEMKGIAIDPGQATATAEGGVIWGELNDAAAEHGLAVTGGAVSGTGIAGYTLGGGLGWLMAKYGLAADNLLAVELVTAEGDVLHVDAESHPDLFWALRGGGGNFGVATSFTYRLHPVRTIVGGLIAHPLDAAPDLLRFYRDAVADASDDLTVFAGLVHAPDGSGAKVAALIVFHTGGAGEAERDLAPFKTWGSPAMVDVGPMPYPVMNTLLDAGFPAGSLNYWLSSFTRGLPDELIDVAVERFATVPSAMTGILLEHFHGAVTRVGASETAVPHREAGTCSSPPSGRTRQTARRTSRGAARRSRRYDLTSGPAGG